jgi:hypothetical protein
MARRALDPDDPDRMARELARGSDNRYAVAQQQQQAFEAEKARVAAISPALAEVRDIYDQSQIPVTGSAPMPGLEVQTPDVGFGLERSDFNPDGTLSMEALRKVYKGSGAEFEKIPFDQWLAGPSSPFRMNAAGTAATYDPSKQTYFPSYDPKSTGLSGFMEKAIPALAFGGMGAGLLGALTGGAYGLAPGSLGAEAGITDFASSFTNPSSVLGDSAGGVNFAQGQFPTLTGGGVNFAQGQFPTLTGGAGVTSAGPLSSLGDMASVLGSGGSLTTGGLGTGLEAALGLPSGGLQALLQGSGINIAGPLGNIGLDALGNQVSNGVNLANSAQTLAGAGSGGGGGGGGGAATTAGTAVAKTGLSKWLQDNLGADVDQNTLGLLGNLLGTGLGIYGANQQANSMEDMYDRFFGLGKPYRDSLAQLNSNPESFYSSPMVQGALQQGSDAMARSLSAKVGNPALNPTALQEMQNYTTRGLLDAYGNRWNQLSSAGQLGVSQSAPLGVGAANANADVGYTAGLGLRSVMGNQNNTAQQLGQALMKQFGLT